MVLENCFEIFPVLSSFPVIVDVNNIVYERNNGKNKPLLNDLLILLKKLAAKGFEIKNIFNICDPSLKKYIDKKDIFRKLVNKNRIIAAPSFKKADEFILGFALGFPFCFIISNDLFREYQEQLPSRKWLKERRISFLFIGENVILSPNIDYEIIEKLLKNHISNRNRSTLDVLYQIEQSEGQFDLF